MYIVRKLSEGPDRLTQRPTWSGPASGSDSIETAEPSRSENGSESVSGEARYAESAEFEPACIICGRTWGPAPGPRPAARAASTK